MKHFLYGPSGSGKTACLDILDGRYPFSCLDLDREIVRRSGRSIEGIFAERGEVGFRAIESAVFAQLCQQPGEGLVALGGGTLIDPDNRRLAETTGRVLLLDAEPDSLVERLRQSGEPRPLISDGSQGGLYGLLETRRKHYASFPLRIDTSRLDLIKAADEIQIAFGRFQVTSVEDPSGAGYPVIVAAGGWAAIPDYLIDAGLPGPLQLVSDSNVSLLYGDSLLEALKQAGIGASAWNFPAGESSKNSATLVSLWETMLQNGLDRQSGLIALGGGVVSDLAGFAAGTYLRGIAWCAVPTSLLAMVDASLGGKTGINLPAGKNLAGMFHPPRLVWVDPDLLGTLPEKELRSGMAEIVKGGVIADAELFESCEGWQGVIDPAKVKPLIARAMAIKIRMIEVDPYEKGARKALNLGHTFGHAIEAASAYRLRHGEAIAIGMTLEARLAERSGLAKPGLADRLAGCLAGLGLPTQAPAQISSQSILRFMAADKKRLASVVRFSLPLKIGEVAIDQAVDPADVEAVLTERENRLEPLRKPI